MSTEPTEQVDANSDDRDSGFESGAGRRVFRFIAAFVVMVMGFLIGYRYAMNTGANIWYLFQVARHTAWLLDRVGESGEVEPFRALVAQGKRDQQAEWAPIDSGAGSVPGPASDEESLTAYESWRYEAQSRIRDGGGIAAHGPIVRVILEKGLSTKQGEIRTEMARLKRGAQAGRPVDDARIAELEAQLSALQTEEQRYPVGPERNDARRGRQFTFRVVPDCGAIPSMSIFLAAVLAFPTRWWKRAAGAAGGLVLLYGINIIRLATLGYIGAIDRSPGQKWFNFIHEYVWQGIFIVFVVAVWMLWIEFVVKVRRA